MINLLAVVIRSEEKYYLCRKKHKPYNNMTKKILLLGSGELGKEFTIAAQRLGQYELRVTLMQVHRLCKWQMHARYSVCWMEKLWTVW